MIIRIEDLPEGRSVKRITFEIDFDETEETSVSVKPSIEIPKGVFASPDPMPEYWEPPAGYDRGKITTQPEPEEIEAPPLRVHTEGKPNESIVAPQKLQHASEGIAPVVPNEMLNATF